MRPPPGGGGGAGRGFRAWLVLGPGSSDKISGVPAAGERGGFLM